MDTVGVRPEKNLLIAVLPEIVLAAMALVVWGVVNAQSSALFGQYLSCLLIAFSFRGRRVGWIVAQLAFIAYGGALYARRFYSGPLTLETAKLFAKNFSDLRSSFTTYLSLELLAALGAIVLSSAFLFFYSERRLSAKIRSYSLVFGTVGALCWTFLLIPLLPGPAPIIPEISADPALTKSIESLSASSAILEEFADAQKPLQSKRNVVVVLVEALRRKGVFRQAEGKNLMPFLTQFGEENISFNDHHTLSPTSLNAMFTLLTGRPAVNFVNGEITQTVEASSGITLFEVLKSYGYHTTYAIAGENEYSGRSGYLERHHVDTIIDWNNFPAKLRIDSWRMLDRPILDAIVKTLRDAIEPQFVVGFLLAPHHPYTLPEPRETVMKKLFPNVGDHNAYRERYYQAVRLVDTDLEYFVSELKKLPEEKQPLLIITGDHGENLGELNGDHLLPTDRTTSLYQEVLEVPFVVADNHEKLQVNYPSSHAMVPGIVLTSLAHGTKIFLDTLASQNALWLKPDFLFLSNPYLEQDYGLIDGHYKFIKHYSDGDAGKLLYDLSLDPEELTNMLEIRPTIVQELERQLDSAVITMARKNRIPYGPEPDVDLDRRFFRLNIESNKGCEVSLNGRVNYGAARFESVKKIFWDWGDGTTGEGALPRAHLYSRPGYYQIQARAVSARDELTTSVDVDILGLPNADGIMKCEGSRESP